MNADVIEIRLNAGRATIGRFIEITARKVIRKWDDAVISVDGESVVGLRANKNTINWGACKRAIIFRSEEDRASLLHSCVSEDEYESGAVVLVETREHLYMSGDSSVIKDIANDVGSVANSDVIR